MFDKCGMIIALKFLKSGKLGDLEASQIKKSEVDAKKVMAFISNFTSPWKIANKDRLCCLASGFPFSEETEIDILQAYELGETLKNMFMLKQLKRQRNEKFVLSFQRQRNLNVAFSYGKLQW